MNQETVNLHEIIQSKECNSNLIQENQELQNKSYHYQQEKCSDQDDIFVLLSFIQIDYRTKLNLKFCIIIGRIFNYLGLNFYQQINLLCQHIVNQIYKAGKYLTSSNQLLYLSSMGMMQINQIIEIFYYPGKQDLTNIIIEQKITNQLEEKIFILGGQSIKIKSRDEINQISLNIILDYLINDLLKNIIITCQFILEKNKKNNPKLLFREFKVLLAKLNYCVEIFPHCVSLSKNDLFSFEKSHPEWAKIIEHVQFKSLDTNENLKNDYSKLIDGMLMLTAIVSKGGEYTNKFVKSAVYGFSIFFYAIMAKRGKSKAEEFIADSKINNLTLLWNMGEQGILRKLGKLNFPNIKFNRKIYIDRYFREITKPYLLSQYQDGTINKINNDIGENFPIPQDLPSLQELYTKPNNQDNYKVQIRVLCHEQLKTICLGKRYIHKYVGKISREID